MHATTYFSIRHIAWRPMGWLGGEIVYMFLYKALLD